MPTGNPIPLPDHWYLDESRTRTRCIVPDCEFVAPSQLVEQQWKEIHDHCLAKTGAEHGLLQIMLNQSICAINNCTHPQFSGRKSSVIRRLFKHEKDAHGSEQMSSICSFVRLAREGRIRKCNKPHCAPEPEPNCERLAYDRMMDKVWALPPEDLILLFERNEYHHPDKWTAENLGEILTRDPLAKACETPPFWWPVKAESFLEHCPPDPHDPEDRHWERVWKYLREEYANGRI